MGTFLGPESSADRLVLSSTASGCSPCRPLTQRPPACCHGNGTGRRGGSWAQSPRGAGRGAPGRGAGLQGGACGLGNISAPSRGDRRVRREQTALAARTHSLCALRNVSSLQGSLCWILGKTCPLSNCSQMEFLGRALPKTQISMEKGTNVSSPVGG